MVYEVTYLSAALAGSISFVTPCVLPLVPPYLCYMAGVSAEQLTGGTTGRESAAASATRPRLLLSSLAFVLGFSIVFILLGAGASTLGGLLRVHAGWLSQVAGLLIIAMGLHFAGILRIPLLYREARFQGGGAGVAGSLVMGLAFAFGWTPCIGPVLGAILAVAGTRDSVGEGASLLAAYSAGLGVPFVAAAVFVNPFMRFLQRFRKHLATVEKIIGGLLVLTGVLFLTGGMQRASFWLLETFPAFGSLG
jgi:cytochrome c-type biogenesis protein